MSDHDPFDLPLDSSGADADFRFELPDAEAGDVLIVDPDSTTAELNRASLEAAGYSVRVVDEPEDLGGELREGVPTVILTELDLGDMTGLELAEKALEHDPGVRVILSTASGDESTAQAALRMGISDYMKKPVDPALLTHSIQRAFHERAAQDHHHALVAWMREELHRRAEAVHQVTVSTLASLANALDMRSPHFHGHSRAVAMQAAAIAQHMGLSEEEIAAIHTAGLLHDVGMMAVPDTIVEKTSALTADEFAVIKSHCQRGVEILAPMRHLGRSIRYVQEHHERIDGSGYPDGKQGDEISLGGQIVGISEAWVAILESRAHRLGMSREEGLALIRGKSGVWFSERVTEALERSDVGMI